MSKITKKECVYKGCNNLSFTSNKTMFRFPSQESKYHEWVNRSKCDVNSMTSSSRKFLCEDHFDSIYMTSNQRRKALLSTAVPYMYEPGLEEPKDICKKVDSDNEIDVDKEPKQKKAKINFQFTLEDNDEEQDESYEVLHVLETDSNHEEDITTEKLEEIKPPSPSKPRIRDESLITTFIFKGEEYIQMPKEMFDEQESSMKQYLMKEVQKCSEDKIKMLEDELIAERKQMDNFLKTVTELQMKYELVVEENEMYKSVVKKAKEALNVG